MQAILAQFEQSVNQTSATPVPLDVPGLTSDQEAAVQKSVQQALDAAQAKAKAAMDALPKDNPNEVFYPQSVPAYAATENFNYLRVKYPEYSYKEATLNPTNPRDRTSDWEADVVNNFRNNDKLTEMFGERNTPAGDALYLARPIKITAASCLDCHSTPDKAPPAIDQALWPRQRLRLEVERNGRRPAGPGAHVAASEHGQSRLRHRCSPRSSASFCSR